LNRGQREQERTEGNIRRTVVFCGVTHAIPRIEEAFPGIEVVDITREVPGGVRGEILFGGASPASFEAVNRGVRWVHWVGTGIDDVPDVLKDVEFFTVSRGASAVAISEYVVAAMSSFARNFPDNWLHRRPAQWYSQPASLLCGATVALFGFGGIGQRIARIALAMEMSVAVLRRTAVPSPVPGVRMTHSFGDLVADADHVILAAPATEETRHVVNTSSLKEMKQGVHLVNVARGSLVDHDALRAALDEGTVARASLDVTDPEPLPDEHWLYTHPKVFLTPHSSWSGPPPLSGAIDLFCENLARFVAGKPLRHLVADGY
jgi:phosphoglycerate dehydrogenase-like enzyme